MSDIYTTAIGNLKEILDCHNAALCGTLDKYFILDADTADMVRKARRGIIEHCYTVNG